MPADEIHWPEDDEDEAPAAAANTAPVRAPGAVKTVELPPMGLSLKDAQAQANIEERKREKDMDEGWGLSPDGAESIPVNQSEISATPLPPLAESESKPALSPSFGQAFAAARKEGVGVFEWRGKKYNTEVKAAAVKQGRPKAAPVVAVAPAHGVREAAARADIYAGPGVRDDQLAPKGRLARGAERVIAQQPEKRSKAAPV